MSLDSIDWDSEMGFFDLFAYPGELAKLSKLARRLTDITDDFEALTQGVFSLVDGLESAGYGDQDSALQVARAVLDDPDQIVAAWRALAELPGELIDRVVGLARRGTR